MKTAPIKPTNNEISAEVAEISTGAAVSWSRVGALLDRVDQEGYWRNESSSFTEWVKLFSSKLGLKEGSVWRMLTSSRFYVELHKDLTSRGINAPPLNQLSNSVSPEKLELLDKLRRVAGQDITDSIASRVIDDSITRNELRSTWETYRPVLEGRTARGRGVEAPRFDQTAPSQIFAYHEVAVMAALQAARPSWTGTLRPATYRIFTHVRPRQRDDEHLAYEFDAVVVVRAKPTSPLVFHGIEIRNEHVLERPRFDEFRQLAESFCDYFWIAFNGRNFVDIDPGVGILTAIDSTVEVVRPPTRNAISATRTGDLAKELLQRLLKA